MSAKDEAGNIDTVQQRNLAGINCSFTVHVCSCLQSFQTFCGNVILKSLMKIVVLYRITAAYGVKLFKKNTNNNSIVKKRKHLAHGRKGLQQCVSQGDWKISQVYFHPVKKNISLF